MTLEAIGRTYGITRERVRQIENCALAAIRKSASYEAVRGAHDELSNMIREHGSLVHEAAFLEHISSDEHIQNHINFYLVLGEGFVRLKEDDRFHHRWTIDEEHAEAIELSLAGLEQGISHDDVLSQDEILARFRSLLTKELGIRIDDEQMLRWLAFSKKVSQNPLGGWGRAASPNIRIRGMRDMAYLVIREHGSPMHFREVAGAIRSSFGRGAHEATCHNELIKDKRFVLVGRGLYALSSWGYSRGTVRDVVVSLLTDGGPLSKEEIIARVLKERYVKENTIIVNLQNGEVFKKGQDGRYYLV